MKEINGNLVIIGGGPGGYSAAFRAADLGQKVILIEKHESLGGVCLNVGCIPSKSLLHAASVINDAVKASEYGVEFSGLKIDINKMRQHKEKTVGRLTRGLSFLAKKRHVEVIRGTASFLNEKSLAVKQDDGEIKIAFDNCIIAAGSRPAELKFLPFDSPFVWNSTDALELKEVPGKLLILGGGIIGLEMATVYKSLGSEITVIEMASQIIPGADSDAVKILTKSMQDRGIRIYTGLGADGAEIKPSGIEVKYGGKNLVFDRVLVSVGRIPNSDVIGLENTGVHVSERGYIITDNRMKTSVEGIFAVGDITGQPMLAHKAVHEAKTAAEVISGLKSAFMAMTIPSVAYTDPEIAWAGISEAEAREKNMKFTVGKFPWSASGRALTQNADSGFSKMIFDDPSGRLIGAVIAGPHAGELISEAVIAIEMGSDTEDLARSVHPHPTLSETLGLAAEAADGTVIDI